MKLFSQGAAVRSLVTLTAATCLVSCGKATDPDAVTIDKLKTPTSLNLVDLGNGDVQLVWTGSNNESDFDGYNIYGAKATAGTDFAKEMDKPDVKLREGDSIELLDDKGDPRDAVKKLMEAMSYNGKDFETAAEKPADQADETIFYPVYTELDGEDKILPSCLPAETAGSDGYKACAAVTKATKGTERPFNGRASYTVTGLVPGSEYCFAVFASKNKGEDISATSSPLRCITPRYKTTLTLSTSNALSSSTKSKRLDIAGARAACSDGDDATKCEITVTDKATGCSNADNSDAAICLEYFNSIVGLTSGVNSVIALQGELKDGFLNLDVPAPQKIDAIGTVQTDNGYNQPYETWAVTEGELFVSAVGTQNSPTSFYYDYVYVSAVDHTKGTVTLEFMLSHAAE